jgi:hypothetical protein
VGAPAFRPVNRVEKRMGFSPGAKAGMGYEEYAKKMKAVK